MKTYSLEELTGNYVGIKDTAEPDRFELKLNILRKIVRKVSGKKMSHDELGKLFGENNNILNKEMINGMYHRN